MKYQTPVTLIVLFAHQYPNNAVLNIPQAHTIVTCNIDFQFSMLLQS